MFSISLGRITDRRRLIVQADVFRALPACRVVALAALRSLLLAVNGWRRLRFDARAAT